MTDRALLQQALEALEEISGGYSQNLIAALRERLAQPEQEPVLVEREACAKVCEENSRLFANSGLIGVCIANAGAIRARGSK